jgi:hypothetical protein
MATCFFFIDKGFAVNRGAAVGYLAAPKACRLCKPFKTSGLMLLQAFHFPGNGKIFREREMRGG